MRNEEFTADAPGRLIKSPKGCWTFVPNALPPGLSPSWDLVTHNSEADRALAELAGIARNLPNPHLLISPFVRREAVLSSRIEGTRSSVSQLVLFEASGEADDESPDVREVANYVQALEYGIHRLKDLPICLRLIKEVHERLMRDTPGQSMRPGDFREDQNWVGRSSNIDDAIFVPAAPADMKDALDDLEKYFHAPPLFPVLVRLALIHYQFEAIHPFMDGNGRLGRLLITLMLCHEKVLPQPLLYLSAYLERNRTDYYRLLLAVSQEGAWVEWIVFFLDGVAEQARDAATRSTRLLELWKSYRTTLQSARSSALLLQLVDRLFFLPVITISSASKALNVTDMAARKHVYRLVDAGVLKEVTGRRRNRMYAASDVIRLVETEALD